MDCCLNCTTNVGIPPHCYNLPTMKWFFIALIIFVLGLFDILSPARNATHYIFSPIQFGLDRSALDVKASFTFYSRLKSIRNDNIELIKENENLKSEITGLKILQEENKTLRELSKVRPLLSAEGEFIIASVMGNKDDNKGATVLLNKGSRQDIKIGDNVVRANFLVGIVRNVSYNQSLVELITSPGISISVKDIDSESGSEGVATGQYGTSILLTRILPSDIIKTGDTVTTSGKDGIFLPGYAVGKIEKINDNASEPLRSAYLETFFDFANLDKVFVVVR